MKTKKFTALLLAAALVMGLTACNSGNKLSQSPEESVNTESTQETEETVTEPEETQESAEQVIDPEVLRGLTLGLVEADYLDEPDLPGTTEDLKKMITKILEKRGAGEDKISEWEQLATGTDRQARNSDVAKACYYTAVYLSEDGIPKTNACDNSGSGRWLTADWYKDPKSIEWNNFIKTDSEGYSFYSRELGYFGEDPIVTNDVNFVTATMFAISMASHYSGQYVLPQNPETDTLLINQELSRSDLLLRAVRIYDSFEDPAEYIPISSLGEANVFSDDVINAAAPVPEVGKTGASDEWIGNSMENYITVAYEGTDGSIPFADLTWNFREADFAAAADLGINYMRIQIYLPFLAFPDYNEDRTQVNKAIIEDFDRAIGWGMKYGMHISLTFMQSMDDDIDGINEISGDGQVLSTKTPPRKMSKEAYAAKAELIEQLEKRYSNIPAKYLSYELECEASIIYTGTPVNTPDEMADMYIDMAQKVWAITPERGISISSDDFSLSDEEYAFWDKIAAAGINLDYHSYEPRGFMAPDQGRMVDPEKMVWPFVDENGIEWNMDKVYEEYIAPWKALADKHGVGFKIGECNPFFESWELFDKPPRTNEAMVAFANDFSATMQKNHISYCLNNPCNGPASAVKDVEPCETDMTSYWAGATYTLKTYNLEGYTAQFYVNEEYAEACYGKK